MQKFIFAALAALSLPLSCHATVPVIPPNGVGLFMYHTLDDMAHPLANDKTQLTTKYPLNPHTNWYLYPEVDTLYCYQPPTLAFSEFNHTRIQAPKAWSLLNKYYKTNWQPNMDANRHIYLMPTVYIDPETCGKADINTQTKAAQTVADSINQSPLVDGLMIDFETAPNHQMGQNILHIINLISKDLHANKRLAIYSGMHTNTAPNNSTSIWPALNREMGCTGSSTTQPCVKGIWTPSIYDDVLLAKHIDGGIDDFYKQSSYLISQQMMNLASSLQEAGLTQTIPGNYYIQPALPGSSSALNAAAYVTISHPNTPATNIDSNDYWGTEYQASTWKMMDNNQYQQIRQSYPASGSPDPAQVHSCQYLCAGLASYSIAQQLLLQSNSQDLYTNKPIWGDIKNNFTHTCDVPSNFDAWHPGYSTPVIPPYFVMNIVKSGLATHLIGVALYQLNYSPVDINGKETDQAVVECLKGQCTGLHPYPSTMSPQSWILLSNWLNQTGKNNWRGWLGNEPLPSGDAVSNLLNSSLNCDGKVVM